jgi:hypothetical protein
MDPADGKEAPRRILRFASGSGGSGRVTWGRSVAACTGTSSLA